MWPFKRKPNFRKWSDELDLCAIFIDNQEFRLTYSVREDKIDNYSFDGSSEDKYKYCLGLQLRTLEHSGYFYIDQKDINIESIINGYIECMKTVKRKEQEDVIRQIEKNAKEDARKKSLKEMEDFMKANKELLVSQITKELQK